MTMSLLSGIRAIKDARLKELLLIAWNPNRVMDWCIHEDEKGRWK